MTRPKRAFSLVIVIVLGVAAFVVATTLLAVSESAGTRVAHSVQGDHAKAIAEAGMERTRAYLQAITTGQLDFDLALDPNDEANCGGLTFSAAPGSQVLRPQFIDGAVVSYRGKDWTRVAYDGGAYLIRFEDDADDFRTQASWDDYTGNTPGAALNCIEGPALAGADNPFRDRNQTISVTVVGIAPGIDPERAVHRSTLRRMETFPGLAVVAGIQVDGNIELNGSAQLNACSPIGSMLVDGNLSAGRASAGCACGESRADNITGNWDHCTAGAACAGVVCLAGTLDRPGPDVPAVLDFTSAAGKDEFIDWSRPCVFTIDDDSSGGGLWFWDATALRGPNDTACSTIQGSPFAWPDINPTDPVVGGGYGRCWTPIIVGLFGGTQASPFGERSGSAWRPTNTVVPATTTDVNNAITAAGYPAFSPAPAGFSKPAWSTACVVNYPSQAPRGCTECNGTNAAMDLASGTYWFTGDTPNQLRAIPAGVYYYDTSLSLTGAAVRLNGPAPGAAPFATFDITQWPLMTIAVKGDLTLQGRAILGVGQDKAAFPSVLLAGNFAFTAAADKFIAGSVWSTGNWDWGGSATNIFHGELHLNGNWTMNGSGDFHWRYLNPLSAAQIFPTPTAPTQTRSLD